MTPGDILLDIALLLVLLTDFSLMRRINKLEKRIEDLEVDKMIHDTMGNVLRIPSMDELLSVKMTKKVGRPKGSKNTTKKVK